jgi:hypothetical protein
VPLRAGGNEIYGGEMGGLGPARRFALALPGVTEEPHFGMLSFRVRGKIFIYRAAGRCPAARIR